MADIKLSDLPSGDLLDSTLFYAVTLAGVEQHKVTGAQIKAYASAAPGLTKQVIFNKDGVLDGTDGVTYDFDNNRLGVGTTVPETLLHVSGSGTSTALGRLDTNIRLQTNTATVNAGSEISFRAQNNTIDPLTGIYAAVSAPVISNGTTGAVGYLAFSNKSNAADTALIERMRIQGLQVNLAQNTTFASYNTADQTTNYERARSYWASNIYNIVTESGGTGTVRQLRIGAGTKLLTFNNGATSTGEYDFSGGTAGTGVILGVNGTYNAATAIQTIIAAQPTINQTGTAGYTAILANVTQTTTGSGVKRLLDLQVGGVSEFSVDNVGEVISTAAFRNAYFARSAAFTADNLGYTYACDATTAAFAATLPAASTCTGRTYIFKKTDATANAVTVTRAGADLIDGVTTYSLVTQYKYVIIQSTGSGWIVIGNN